jgi:hypothetical protein
MTQNGKIRVVKRDEREPKREPKPLDNTLRRQLISVMVLVRREFPEEFQQIVEISLAK